MAVGFYLSLLMLLVLSAAAKKNDVSTDLLMPDVSPQVHDTYYCHPLKMPEEPMYITGFEPHAKKETAHHMLLFGCKTPGMRRNVWNCGEMAATDDDAPDDLGPVCESGQTILYAWAMDAPKLALPKDVGFKVGGDTGVDYLVLQVHYGIVDKFVKDKSLTDASGMTLNMTPDKQPKLAGVYLMAAYGTIPNTGKEVYQEVACLYEDKPTMHPFAFRTHTHSLGTVVAGYRVTDIDGPNTEWTEIGRRNPQLPQMFYPIRKNIPISQGDVLAARCTMVNNLDHVVSTGATMKDEMCNFYMMYFVENVDRVDFNQCGNDIDWNEINVPPEISKQASTVPEDPDEEVMDM